MSFKFEVGQEVIRVDSTTGKPWGLPVVIEHRNVQVLAAHGICEKRYMFKEDGYTHDYPESALRAWVKVQGPPAEVTDADMAQMVGRANVHSSDFSVLDQYGIEEPKKLSWWSWLFHD